MPFTIPDGSEISGPSYNQSRIDSRHWDAYQAAIAGYGIIAGGLVTAAGGNMVINISAVKGKFSPPGKALSYVTGGPGSITVPTADATNPRIDLVVLYSSGAIALIAGTAAALTVNSGPMFPTRIQVGIDANGNILGLPLARIDVRAGVTTILSSDILDLRLNLLSTQLDQVAPPVTINSSTYSIPGSYDSYPLTLAQSTSITMPPALAGQSIMVGITQDSVGGRVPTFVAVRWQNGLVPSWSGKSQGIDYVRFVCLDGTHWEGQQIGTSMSVPSNFGAYDSRILNRIPGPIAYWPLGENGTAVADATSHGNNGTTSGGVSRGVVGPLLNEVSKATSFDGVSGVVNIPAQLDLNLSGPFTHEFWVQGTFVHTNPSISGKGQKGSTTGFVVDYSNTGAIKLVRSGVTVTTPTGVITPSVPAYVAFVYDGTNAIIYVNGVQKSSVPVTFTADTDTGSVTLGNGLDFANITLSKYALSNYAVSAAEILGTWNLAMSGIPRPPISVTAAVTSGNVVVSWPAAYGTGLTSYTVISTPGSVTKTVDGATLTATMTGLTGGTAYTFTVTATNSFGTSVKSTASNSVTAPASSTSFTLQNVINSMTVPHGAHYPVGPDGYSWQNGPQYAQLQPNAAFNRGTVWGWVWPDHAFGNPPADPPGVSIQVRHMVFAIFSNNTNGWKYLIQSDDIYGEWDYGPGSGHAVGGGIPGQGGQILPTLSAGAGGGVYFTPRTTQVFQFYPHSGWGVLNGIEAQMAYCEWQCRVIVTPGWGGSNNTSQAHYLGLPGADWNLSDFSNTQNAYNAGAVVIPNDGTWVTASGWTGPSGFNPNTQGNPPWTTTPDEGVPWPNGWSIAQLQAKPPILSSMGPPT